MPVAEQRLHQLGLGDVRVLVLVEQHRVEAIAVVATHLGVGSGDLHRELDLVAEVDHAQLALEPRKMTIALASSMRSSAE